MVKSVNKSVVKSLPLTLLSAASDFYFAATACVCATRLGRLGKPFIHFFLVGEQLLDARALLHALEMERHLGDVDQLDKRSRGGLFRARPRDKQGGRPESN
jgi:hypothetical protein